MAKLPSPKLDQLRQLREAKATRFAAAEKATLPDLRGRIKAVKLKPRKPKKSRKP